MAFKTISLKFAFSREQFIHMLLLNGSVRVPTSEVGKSGPMEEIEIKSVKDHEKRGTPGVEDGKPHFIQALVEFRGKIWAAHLSPVSEDGGKTYSAILTLQYFTDDRFIVQ